MSAMTTLSDSELASITGGTKKLPPRRQGVPERLLPQPLPSPFPGPQARPLPSPQPMPNPNPFPIATHK